MTTWVVITEHPPQLCQTSSAICGAKYAELGPAFAKASEAGELTFVAGPLITSDHRSFLVIEAETYDAVRKFTVESGAVQWNAVTTIPTIDYAQALEEIAHVTPIFP